MSDDSKSDPDMDTRTIKATAGMTTNPIPVDDGESVAKEAKLVTSAFDRTKYKTKNGTVQNVSVYMITSNIINRLAFRKIVYLSCLGCRCICTKVVFIFQSHK